MSKSLNRPPPGLVSKNREPLRPGDPRTVGPWKILSRIGAGGMGVVYYANRRGQKVALKIMRDLYGTEHNIGRYFARELANLRLVSGPYVAALVDADMEAASAWIAFEYIDGPNLKVFVDSNGPLLEDAWRKFAAALLKGISEVHARGVIHRDLKPSNIVIASTGPKLIDFGIAQALDDTPFTRTGMIVGTPTWMAPEQIDAMVVGKPADLFAAGSILLYAATGREPWGTGTTKEMQARICRGQPDMGGLSAMQSRLISALLIKDPIKRATAEDAVRVLAGGNYRPGFPWRTVFNWTSGVLVYLVVLSSLWYLFSSPISAAPVVVPTVTAAVVPTVNAAVVPTATAAVMSTPNADLVPTATKNSSRNGQDTETHADGTTYTGGFKDGNRNGQGTLTYADGTMYTGEWKDGKPNGQGTYTYADATTYSYTVMPGEYLALLARRFGTTVSEMSRLNNLTSNVVFVGQVLVVPGGIVGFKDGKRSGQGTWTYADGSTYTGEWKDGKPNGLGIMKYRYGRTYIGVWNDGVWVP